MVTGKRNTKKEEVGCERCPLCQVPLYLLAEGSEGRHVSECVNVSSARFPGQMFSDIWRNEFCNC